MMCLGRNRSLASGGLQASCSAGLAAILTLWAASTIAPGSRADEFEPRWIVATIAGDGAWGVGQHLHVAHAIKIAIEACRTRSNSAGDCGAQYSVTRGGWIIGMLCEHHKILVTGDDLREAELAALERELSLKQLYESKLPACHRLLTINPMGTVTHADHRRGPLLSQPAGTVRPVMPP